MLARIGLLAATSLASLALAAPAFAAGDGSGGTTAGPAVTGGSLPDRPARDDAGPAGQAGRGRIRRPRGLPAPLPASRSRRGVDWRILAATARTTDHGRSRARGVASRAELRALLRRADEILHRQVVRQHLARLRHGRQRRRPPERLRPGRRDSRGGRPGGGPAIARRVPRRDLCSPPTTPVRPTRASTTASRPTPRPSYVRKGRATSPRWLARWPGGTIGRLRRLWTGSSVPTVSPDFSSPSTPSDRARSSALRERSPPSRC